MDLEDYTNILTALERDIKIADPTAAYNIGRELSVIYLKMVYLGEYRGVPERLISLTRYIAKTIPDYCDATVELIEDAALKIKDRA